MPDGAATVEHRPGVSHSAPSFAGRRHSAAMPTHLPNRQARSDVPADAFCAHQRGRLAVLSEREARRARLLSDDEHRGRSLAIVVGGSSVAIVAGLPFGILIGQTWGWRSAMWVLVALCMLSIVAVRLLPAAHAPGCRFANGPRLDRSANARHFGWHCHSTHAGLHRHRLLARGHAQLRCVDRRRDTAVRGLTGDRRSLRASAHP